MAEPARSTSLVEGVLECIAFRNDDTHFTVAKVQPDAGGAIVTCVGPLFGVDEGSWVRIEGTFEESRFGRQLRVKSFEAGTPNTAIGIQKYLSAGLVKGIGEELAKRIVKHFGAETLEVLEKQPKRLLEVEGIGRKRLERLKEAWGEHCAARRVLIFLRGHGVGAAHAARILKAYGDHADEVVRKNPYRLAEDIHGIGFLTADRIGRELGIQHDAPERVEAGLVHVLQQARDQGHTCAPRAEAIDAAARLLEVDEDAVGPSIDALIAQNAVVQQEHQGDPHLWLKPLFLAETTLARDLVRLLEGPDGLPPIKVEIALDWVERRRSIELARSQRGALRRCLTEKVCVITGGPGVGKTTIIASLIDIVTAKRTRVRLAAPTGRAAKRLSEATGREAVTIHRLLKWNPRTRDFEHNADEPIPEVDLLVVDEASMIDALLMHRLVAALPPRAHLVIVGDKDQLPSVGPGAILRDLIASGRVPIAELIELHRQAQGSRIVAASHEVNQGRVPELPPPEAPSDLHFVDARTPEEAVEAVCYLVLRELPRRYGFSPRKDIQVLAPMHRGVCGIKALNEALAAELDKSAPPGPILTRGDSRYRVGTKVIQLRNNYELEVYNGDVGIVTEVSKEKGELIVELDDGRRVRYERADLDQIEVAYAISIHKSQGSEYPCVVIPFLTQHFLMLQRNLLYTALTRAKKHAVIVGQRRAIRMAAENTRTVVRLTSLAERLQR